MNGEASTPEPKQRKQGNPASAERSKKQQNRRSTHRGRHDNVKPEWDDNPNGTGDVSGDFDENGQFVMSDPSASAPKGARKAKGIKHRGQNQNQPPSWDAVPSGEGEGTFDANGNFVMPGSLTVEQTAPKSVKKPKKPKQIIQSVGNVPNLPHGVAAISASPARPVGFGATPMKAYAGPTFHASPAASELPMPKFFSRSAPKAVYPGALSSRLAQEESLGSHNSDNKDDSSSDEVSPEGAAPLTGLALPRREESPLDLFFNADRKEKAEKAKRLSSGPSSVGVPQQAPSQNNPNTQNVPQHWASIYGARPKHNRNFSTGSTKDIFSLDMEGDTSVSSVKANLDPNSPSRRQIRTPESTPGNHEQYAYGGHSPRSLNDRPVSVPAQASAPYPFTPISAGATPPPQYQTPPHAGDLDQGLHHYGNRNLSPLFSAMKTDPNNRRQSGLRQEVLRSPQTKQGEFPAYPAHSEISKATALDFLNAQIAKSQGQPSAPGTIPVGSSDPARADLTPTHTRVHGENSRAPKGQALSGDLKSMENDLKRMLNLSGGAGGGGFGGFGGFGQ